MLALLKIQNLALVEQLHWELSPGLTCVTGETGAGKSVIVGALKLLLGQRADKSLIRSGQKSCAIEAIFEIPPDSPVPAALELAGLPPCDDGQIIIRRSITPTASRQFINDSPATLPLLRDIGSLLVDLHGPGDHQSLLAQDRQLWLLDAFASLSALRTACANAWNAWNSARAEWKQLSSSGKSSRLEIDLLQHQLEEISDAAPSPAEELDLEDRWQRARNASRLASALAKSLAILSSDSNSILDRLAELSRATHEIERLDPSTPAILSSLHSASSHLRELDAQLQDYAANLDTDPQSLAALEDRINTLQSLKRKYGPSIADVLEYADSLRNRLGQMEHREEHIERLAAQVQAKRAEFDAIARQLSSLRLAAAPELSRQIRKHLADLGFRQSAFEISWSTSPEPSPTGYDIAEFQFGPNPGEPLKPLRLIASSGEIARVMLAVKSALAAQDSTPLLVFDEIDANVGGEIARAVGLKMATLGSRHQVISITHFPQVAALAHHHFLVEKSVLSGRTFSSLRPLSGDSRVDELVRMLGSSDTVSARQLASELLSPR